MLSYWEQLHLVKLIVVKLRSLFEPTDLLVQVIQPDPSKKQVYEDAFQRHYNIGKQIFESEP